MGCKSDGCSSLQKVLRTQLRDSNDRNHILRLFDPTLRFVALNHLSFVSRPIMFRLPRDHDHSENMTRVLIDMRNISLHSARDSIELNIFNIWKTRMKWLSLSKLFWAQYERHFWHCRWSKCHCRIWCDDCLTGMFAWMQSSAATDRCSRCVALSVE